MKRIKYLPINVLNKELLSNYDLIIIPVFSIYNKLKIGNIKIITIHYKDIMFIRFTFNSYKNITIFKNMLETIKLNEYKNIFLFNNELLTLKTYVLLKDFVNNNTLDIDIIS